MIVADASALFEVLDGSNDGAKIAARLFAGGETVCVPHLVDIEIASVLRKNVLAKRIDVARAEAALTDLIDLPLPRFAHASLLPRLFALRATIAAYDATNVVLAESLGATLVTCDGRLGRAAAGVCGVEVF